MENKPSDSNFGLWPALNENDERMIIFINEALLSIYFLDPQTKKILFSNSALSELLGYSNDELASMEIYDFIERSRQNVNDLINDVINVKNVNNSESLWRKKDGTQVNVFVSCFYREHNGRKIIYVAASDITKRKKVESDLEEIHKELETFIYKASHDIRGPLASIMGLTNIGKLEVSDKNALNYFNKIELATKKLDYVLIELVKAMKIKSTESFVDEINFERLISEVISRFEHVEGYSRLRIETKIELSKAFTSNKFIIETILQNLVENAIKYQDPGRKNPFLKIDVCGNEEGVLITVKDNGIGIEEDLQAKVFDMYFRAIEDSKGSGLGLYLVKNGVKKLRGNIELESVHGEGATFRIQLYS